MKVVFTIKTLKITLGSSCIYPDATPLNVVSFEVICEVMNFVDTDMCHDFSASLPGDTGEIVFVFELDFVSSCFHNR